MAQILSLVSSKGGVGKSTFTINFSSALADMGLKVLIVDLDSQQSVTKFFNYPKQPEAGLLEFIIDRNPNAVTQTHIDGLSIVINNDLGEELNKWMENHFSGNFALKTILQRIKNDYDIILIDTQGKDGRGQLQEMALIAADTIITPTTPDVISSQELPRVISIYNQVVNGMEDMGIHSSPATLKVLINRLDNTTVTKNVTAAIRNEFGDIARHISVLKTMIPDRVVYRNAISSQTPAHRLDNSRIMDTSAINVMETLIHEILPHYADLTIGGKNEQK